MLSNASEVLKRLKANEYARMKDIYAKCDEKGLSRGFADSLYYRMILNPMRQTRCLISLEEAGYLSDSENYLEEWYLYLEIMLELSPQHEKAEEWRQSRKLMEQKRVV